jgi:trimethylamine-N-oxide reductase (cytochrome c)
MKANSLTTAAREKQFTATLVGLEVLLRRAARKYPEFAQRLGGKDLIAQIKLRDESLGRAAKIMKPKRDYLAFINAVKNFQMAIIGPDELTVWWSETLTMLFSLGLEFGTDLGDGVRRFTSNKHQRRSGLRLRQRGQDSASNAHRLRRRRC